MSKIIRTEPGPILSKAVEYHGFVYLPGITARDTKQDIKGQTADVLTQIVAMLEQPWGGTRPGCCRRLSG